MSRYLPEEPPKKNEARQYRATYKAIETFKAEVKAKKAAEYLLKKQAIQQETEQRKAEKRARSEERKALRRFGKKDLKTPNMLTEWNG